MIYDCFTFFNEIEILKIRLELYYNIVDYFVISECSVTQTGIKKEFNFEQKKDLFQKYLDKIIYIKADNPPVYDKNENFCWSIENYQRNQIFEGLKNCNKNDIILVSDIDEFWNPFLFEKSNDFFVEKFQNGYGRKYRYKQFFKLFFLNPFLTKSKDVFFYLKYTPVVLEQDFFYYFINYKRNEKWHGTVVSKYKNIKTIQNLRDRRNYLPFVYSKKFVPGWHFSYLGGKEKIKQKLKSIVEGKICSKENLDSWIDNCLKNRIDLFDRKKSSISYISPEDVQFPLLNFIKENNSNFIYEE